MLLTADEFAAGAQQLAAAWQAHLPGEQPWQWVPSQAPFAASAGGGYLAKQHTLAPAQPPAAGAAGQQRADTAGASCDEVEISASEDEEQDLANARLASNSAAGSSEAAEQSAPVAAAAAAPPAAAAGLSLTCHIAYHPSYQVPVLYLEAAGRDGAPLALAALLEALPRLRDEVEGGQPYTVLTQEEHPFLQRPWFMLHPCQTAAIMQLLVEPASGGESPSATATAVLPAPAPAAVAAAAQPAEAAEQQASAAGAGLAGGQAGRPRPLRYLLAWLSVVGQPLGIRVPPKLLQGCR